MTRIQFTRRPDRRGSALKSAPRAWHPWPSDHLSVCGHLQPCRWSAWPTSLQAAKKRMWIVHWADAQLGTSDAPQQGTSQPKIRVGEQSAEDIVAAQIRLRGRDQASKRWPTSRGQLTSANIEHTSPFSEMPLCLPVCLSVCLSVSLSLSLIVCLCLCLSVRCVPASVGLVCGVRCQLSLHPLRTSPLRPSLSSHPSSPLPQYAASAMNDHRRRVWKGK